MPPPQQLAFDVPAYLAKAGSGRTIVNLRKREAFFSQGDPADSVFYLREGRVKVTVVTVNGREATVMLLSDGEFLGEEAMAAVPGQRLTTATAVTPCAALRIAREEFTRVMHEEHAFSDFFSAFLLARGMKVQSDLVDQLFNRSEKRLARTLLLMAEYDQPGEPESLLPRVSQESLAEMIGSTRSRVNFFMNRFRKLGYIQYNGRIRVEKSLLNVLLND